MAAEVCAGIDVGGVKKGFHAAAISGRSLEAGPEQLGDVTAAVEWVRATKPAIVAIDSPKTCATRGERSRAGERELARSICGIRWTPERPKLDESAYYGWILNGLDLYDALRRLRGRHKPEVIEVFPTASWTVWAGRRGKTRRARWSREVLDGLELDGLPSRRMNQDDRDAIAAAITASQHSTGDTRSFGEIVVPTARPFDG